jgi:DNA-binding NarL/FixJ family response regulator
VAEANNNSQIKVLIVDDLTSLRLQLKLLLEQYRDFAVIGEAENGEEALIQVSRLKPDVILMDVSMPVMDGIEASRTILEKSPAIKIIMLTASDNERDIFASLAAGACGYCLKDFAPERIIAAIQGVQAGDIWLDSAIAAKVIKLYEAPRPTLPGDGNGRGSAAALESDQAEQTREIEEPLSQRELDVLRLVVKGYSNKQIAEELTVSAETIKTHMRHIMEKLAVNDRTHAAVKALRKGLL